MLHAHIAQRAFNTPLLVEPDKAMAFLSGLGPRILGRRVEFADETHLQGLVETATLPARAGILANGLAESCHRNGHALWGEGGMRERSDQEFNQKRHTPRQPTALGRVFQILPFQTAAGRIAGFSLTRISTNVASGNGAATCRAMFQHLPHC